MDTKEVPTAEIVEAPASAEVTEVTAETPVEEWDKERAKATILKLRAEEKEVKKQLKELETLKAEKASREEAEMTESQKATKRAEDAEAKALKLETDILRRDVIAEAGLPAVFTDRLKGITKEEMLADAQELAKTLPQLKAAPHVPPTNPNNANIKETDAAKRERLFGKQGNPFDMETIKAQGGGVVWNK